MPIVTDSYRFVTGIDTHARLQPSLRLRRCLVVVTQETRQAADEALDGVIVNLITATQPEQDLRTNRSALIAVVLRYLQLLHPARLDLPHVHSAHVITNPLSTHNHLSTGCCAHTVPAFTTPPTRESPSYTHPTYQETAPVPKPYRTPIRQRAGYAPLQELVYGARSASPRGPHWNLPNRCQML